MIKYSDFTPEQQRLFLKVSAELVDLPLEHRVYALWSELGGLLATRQGEMSDRALTALRIAHSALWEGMQDEPND